MIKTSLHNNIKFTLISSLDSEATVLPLSSLSGGIIPQFTPSNRTSIIVTLTNLSETLIEIISVDSWSGVDYNITRGLESTSPLTWPSGTKVECRLTADILRNLNIRDRDFPNLIDIGSKNDGGKYAYFESISTWTASSPIFIGDTRRVGVNDRVITYHSDGTTGAVAPVVGALKDGTAMCTVTDYVGLSLTGIAIGENTACLKGGILIGGDTESAVGSDNVVIGNTAKAYSLSDNSIIIGNRSLNFNAKSMILGSDIVSSYDEELATDKVFGQPTFFSYTAYQRGYQPSSETILWSLPMDLAGGTTWTASTVTAHGKVAKKTGASNNTQYFADSIEYAPSHAAHTGNYTATSSTGSTEPTWTTTQFDSISDGADIVWTAMKNTGGSLFGTLPHKFVPTEFGIIVHDISAITVQPTIQLGSTLNGTDLLGATTTTKLTAVGKLEKYVITNPIATDTFGFNINTLATGTRLVCRMYVKGFYWKHWI